MTDTTKRYRLLKDLPDAEIGREFVYNKTYNKYFLDGNVLGSNWDTEWVENNPTWFTEVLPVSEPVTEKIKVGKMCCIVGGEGYGEMKWDLRFKTNKHIHYDKAMKLCNALESALNDTVVEDRFDGKRASFYAMDEVGQWAAADKELTKEKIDELMKEFHNQPLQFYSPPKRYSQSEVDAIRADTWYAARKITDKVVGEIDFKDGDRCPFYEKYFNSINDYLSSLNLNSNDTGKEDNETKSANWRSENLSKQSAPEPSALPNKEQDKPVLFTTEDGVEYRDSLTDYYEVRDFKHSGRCNGMSWYRPENGNKYFSTSEAAEQYILENKPFLSIKDIEIMANYKTNFKFELSKSELYHYAKQKLNK